MWLSMVFLYAELRRHYPGGLLSNHLHHQLLPTGRNTCICFEEKREKCGGGQISGIYEYHLKGNSIALANSRSYFSISASIHLIWVGRYWLTPKTHCLYITQYLHLLFILMNFTSLSKKLIKDVISMVECEVLQLHCRIRINGCNYVWCILWASIVCTTIISITDSFAKNNITVTNQHLLTCQLADQMQIMVASCL